MAWLRSDAALYDRLRLVLEDEHLHRASLPFVRMVAEQVLGRQSNEDLLKQVGRLIAEAQDRIESWYRSHLVLDTMDEAVFREHIDFFISECVLRPVDFVRELLDTVLCGPEADELENDLLEAGQPELNGYDVESGDLDPDSPSLDFEVHPRLRHFVRDWALPVEFFSTMVLYVLTLPVLLGCEPIRVRCLTSLGKLHDLVRTEVERTEKRTVAAYREAIVAACDTTDRRDPPTSRESLFSHIFDRYFLASLDSFPPQASGYLEDIATPALEDWLKDRFVDDPEFTRDIVDERLRDLAVRPADESTDAMDIRKVIHRHAEHLMSELVRLADAAPPKPTQVLVAEQFLLRAWEFFRRFVMIRQSVAAVLWQS